MPDSIGGMRPSSQSIKLEGRNRAGTTNAYKRKKNCSCWDKLFNLKIFNYKFNNSTKWLKNYNLNYCG